MEDYHRAMDQVVDKQRYIGSEYSVRRNVGSGPLIWNLDAYDFEFEDDEEGTGSAA